MAKLDGISKIGSEKIAPIKATAVITRAEIGESETIDATKAENYESLFPEPTVSISSPPVWIWWILLGIAATAIALLGYYVANGKLNQWLSVPSDSVTASPAASTPAPITSTPTPSSVPSVPAAVAQPTPSPTPSTAPVSVKVLNGTATAGAASAAADSLRQAGITVSGIGNAQSRSNTTTTIYYQVGRLATAQAVQKALTHYTSTLVENSSQTGGDTALVVLGVSQ